jgi:hypothetical protein
VAYLVPVLAHGRAFGSSGPSGLLGRLAPPDGLLQRRTGKFLRVEVVVLPRNSIKRKEEGTTRKKSSTTYHCGPSLALERERVVRAVGEAAIGRVLQVHRHPHLLVILLHNFFYDFLNHLILLLSFLYFAPRCLSLGLRLLLLLPGSNEN